MLSFLLFLTVFQLTDYQIINEELKKLQFHIGNTDTNPIFLRESIQKLEKLIPNENKIKFYIDDLTVNQKRGVPQIFENPNPNLTCFKSSDISLDLRFYQPEQISKLTLDSTFPGCTPGRVEIRPKDENFNIGKLKNLKIVNGEKNFVVFPNEQQNLMGFKLRLIANKRNVQEFCLGPISFEK